ncbi:type VI secretion system-associated FHA domain protein TagH [Pseudoxanthomonas sp.]|uniref:type VI secretion system-associated FHA domain protein TagH n=1 Tax=Pseudoxanthomonas sp. TaxID=1871049 RepID=UPI00260A4FFC|nr:type VI secretion system-associated FHA domain protein TagH [Pseudoxanthomonas sp.]WDS37806.1 MAG: type VI secretion system-associated FHA domain protein TagH [Pseudoxanthomonas sp.]
MATHPKLVLSLLSGAVPGIHRTRVEFDGRGGSIGRSEQSAWILTGPGVSRTHAQVRFLNGMYFIEDASTNGLLLNGVPLARSEPAALGDGDRLRLDNMEIGVALQAAAPPAAAAASFPAEASYGPDATLFAAPPAATPPQVASPPVPPPLGLADPGLDDVFGLVPVQGGIGSVQPAASLDFDDLLGAGELDPLRLLDPASPGPVPAAIDHGWNHSPASSDHFHPPRTAGQDLALPENWDMTTGDFAGQPARVASPPAAMPPQRAAPAGAPEEQVAFPGDPRINAILSIVVDGVMDVLRARAEIKNTFRLPVTVIQRSENNPLKFAATPGEALQKLMASDGGAFLSGEAAFEDAFDDIRCHQMAMLAGMRAAFEATLFHFSPGRLEQEVDGGRRNAFSGKGRYWERYRENFDVLAKDPDECFRRLFGDEFARAYEAQLARLKSARRAQR